MQKILVDGYNVIHADERFKRAAARELEQARGLLIAAIRSYAASKKARVTLVFDGAGGMTEAETVVPGKLQVLFSGGGQTADELILQILEDSRNPREYIVVTSDMTDIGGRARAMGAKVLGSPEFLKRLQGKPAARGERADGGEKRHDGGETDAESLDYWMDQFGGENGTGEE